MPSALLQKTPYGSFGGQPGGVLSKTKRDQSPSVMDKEELPLTAEELARSLAEKDAIGPPTVGPISIDPTDWLTHGGLAKVGAALGKVAGFGILRPGGIRGLNVVHGTSDSILLRLANDVADNGKAVLHAPSFEVSTLPEGRAGFGTGDTTIIPKPSAVDPRNRPDAHLYNRDAYVSRSGGRPYSKEELEAILEDSSLTEGDLPTISQALSIAASPKFQSFADYEVSPMGAAVLNKRIKDISYGNFYKMGIPGDVISGANHSKEGLLELFDAVRTKAGEGDKLAKATMKRLEQQGSTYGELKLTRDLGLNQDNIATILFNPSGFTTEKEKEFLRSILEDRLDIPTGTVDDFLPSEARQKMHDFLSTNIKAYKKVVEETEDSLGSPGTKFLNEDVVRKMNEALVSQLPEGAKKPKYTRSPLSSIVFTDMGDPFDGIRRDLLHYYEEAMRGPHYIETVNAITEEAVKK